MSNIDPKQVVASINEAMAQAILGHSLPPSSSVVERAMALQSLLWGLGSSAAKELLQAANDEQTKKAARKHRYYCGGTPFIEPEDYTPGMATGLLDSDGQVIHDGSWVSLAGNMTADDSMGFLPNGWVFDEDDRYQVYYDARIFTWGLRTDADLADPTQRKWLNHATSLLHDGSCKLLPDPRPDTV